MKLSREALLCFVGIFQKGIFGVADAAQLMREMKFKIKDDELIVENPQQYQLTESEIEMIKFSTLITENA